MKEKRRALLPSPSWDFQRVDTGQNRKSYQKRRSQIDKMINDWKMVAKTKVGKHGTLEKKKKINLMHPHRLFSLESGGGKTAGALSSRRSIKWIDSKLFWLAAKWKIISSLVDSRVENFSWWCFRCYWPVISAVGMSWALRAQPKHLRLLDNMLSVFLFIFYLISLLLSMAGRLVVDRGYRWTLLYWSRPTKECDLVMPDQARAIASDLGLPYYETR